MLHTVTPFISAAVYDTLAKQREEINRHNHTYLRLVPCPVILKCVCGLSVAVRWQPPGEATVAVCPKCGDWHSVLFELPKNKFATQLTVPNA